MKQFTEKEWKSEFSNVITTVTSNLFTCVRHLLQSSKTIPGQLYGSWGPYVLSCQWKWNTTPMIVLDTFQKKGLGYFSLFFFHLFFWNQLQFTYHIFVTNIKYLHNKYKIRKKNVKLNVFMRTMWKTYSTRNNFFSYKLFVSDSYIGKLTSHFPG